MSNLSRLLFQVRIEVTLRKESASYMYINTAETAKRDIQLSLRVLSAVIRDENPEPEAVRELLAQCPADLRDLPPDELACALIRQNVAVLHASERRVMVASA